MFKMNYSITFFLCLFISCTPKTKKDARNSATRPIPKIDSSNYYDYLGEWDSTKGSLATDHLRAFEIVPILREEMEKAGIEHYVDNVIYKISPTQDILITAYSTTPEFGFVYVDKFYAFPSKNHRTKRIREYEESYFKPGAILEQITYRKLPDNIYLLPADLYWYQYYDSGFDDPNLVTKKIAIEIFRQDVRSILSQMTSP